MKPKHSKIGYACMNQDIRPSHYKTFRIANMSDEKMDDAIRHNLNVFEASIDYNIQHGIEMFRVSSSIIPFASSPLNTYDWVSPYGDIYERIKQKIDQSGMRISTHPGQYTVINSPNPDVVKASIAELHVQSLLLNLLSEQSNMVMVLHVGGIYGNKQTAIERFITVANGLDESIRAVLAVENDDQRFTVEDVLFIAKQTQLPVVFDNLHHQLNPSLPDMSMTQILNQVAKTWKARGVVPKMHYSQQDPHKRPGAHSPTIDLEQFAKDYQTHYQSLEVDIMLEVKDKNRSTLKVLDLFQTNNKTLEAQWARYKYLVMSHSQAHYNKLRTLFKNNPHIDPVLFYQIVDEALLLPDDLGAQQNAIQHVWGYFKKVASEPEKTRYLKLVDQFSIQKASEKTILKYLSKLAIHYDVAYLLQSYYLNKYESSAA